MDAIKFGFKYWKKYIVAAVVLQFVSFLAIIADLLIPFVSELLLILLLWITTIRRVEFLHF